MTGLELLETSFKPADLQVSLNNPNISRLIARAELDLEERRETSTAGEQQSFSLSCEKISKFMFEKLYDFKNKTRKFYTVTYHPSCFYMR